MRAIRLSRNQRLFGLLFMAAVATTAISYSHVFELYELQTYDWRYKLRGDRPWSRQISLIHIAEDTLELYGGWPFDRSYHGALAHILKFGGMARATAYDIIFPEDAGAADTEFGTWAQKAGNVYFGVALSTPYYRDGQQVADKFVAPLSPTLSPYADKITHLNVVADIDGKRRRIPPVIYHEGRAFIQLAVRLAMDVLGVKESELRLEPGKLHLGDKVTIPLDEEQCMLISFAGRWTETFDHYSYAHILASGMAIAEGKRPKINLARTFRDRICIVGYTAAASVDVDATPLETVYPMVGVHANALNSILQQDFIRRASRLVNALVALIMGVFVLWMSLTRKPLFAFRMTILILLLWVTFATFAFTQLNWWFDLFYPAAIVVIFSSVSIVARAVREMRRRELIEKELTIASQIQQSFLPEKMPQAAGLAVDVFFKPAKAVGGDLYAFVPAEDGRLGVMLGDVSGKGTPAALFMAKIVSEFKFSSLGTGTPAQVLQRLNDKVSAERTGGLFVTMVYAMFDPAAQRMVFSNGGHLPVVAVSADGTSRQISGDGGMPVGVMPDIPFSDTPVELRPGDCFAFYSDGVSEARDRHAREWGIEALEACLRDHRQRSASEILEATVQRLNAFMNKADQHDDITLMVVKVGEGS